MDRERIKRNHVLTNTCLCLLAMQHSSPHIHEALSVRSMKLRLCQGCTFAVYLKTNNNAKYECINQLINKVKLTVYRRLLFHSEKISNHLPQERRTHSNQHLISQSLMSISLPIDSVGDGRSRTRNMGPGHIYIDDMIIVYLKAATARISRREPIGCEAPQPMDYRSPYYFAQKTWRGFLYRNNKFAMI